MADPQNLPGGAQDVSEIMFTGNLHGSGTINVLSNGQDNNPDGGAGFRFRGTGVSDFAGTVVFGNNVKGELQTGSVGLYSPAGTGKLIVTAGDATLAGTLTTQTTTGGYSELNLRNNSTGNATFGNDIEVAGTGLAVLNPLGNAPIGAIIGMGNLKIGAGQELGIYDASGNVHAAAFNSVTLTGGNATFSPRTANFGTAGTVGGDLLLGSITELAPNSSITMTGLRTLTLTGSNSYTGGTTVVAGTLVTNTNFSNGTLTINGGKAKVAAKATNNDPSGTTTVPSLTIALGATLDLTNNSAVINYTTSPLTDIRGQLLSGYANGAWTGTGLSSSSAQAAASGAIKTAIGYTDTGTALMLKYTVSGDANLDGVTNALDFNALASNFGQPSADRWNKGDFNYDGVVNTGDFTALAQNFNAILPATPPPAPALGSLVPEPTSLAMLGLLTVITRRRHQLSRA
jgi:autotransporter-associated beta strand protein